MKVIRLCGSLHGRDARQHSTMQEEQAFKPWFWLFLQTGIEMLIKTEWCQENCLLSNETSGDGGAAGLMATPRNQTFQLDFWLHLLIIKITRGPSERTNGTNNAENAAASALMAMPSSERRGCVLGCSYPLAACTFLLLYEMPLGEIDKMLDLIKKETTITTPGSIFILLQRTARNISSHPSRFSFQSHFTGSKRILGNHSLSVGLDPPPLRREWLLSRLVWWSSEKNPQ